MAMQMSSASDKLRGLFARLPFSWHVLGAIVLGVLLAKWVWILFAPGEMAVVAVAGRSDAVEADKLFGEVADATAGAQAVALPNAKLVGVFSGSHGFAILELEGKKQLGVALGQEIVQGVKLVKVAADHVVIEGGGNRQRIDLAMKSAAAGPASPVAAPTAQQPTPAYGAAAAPANAASALPAGADAAIAGMSPQQREEMIRKFSGKRTH